MNNVNVYLDIIPSEAIISLIQEEKVMFTVENGTWQKHD